MYYSIEHYYGLLFISISIPIGPDATIAVPALLCGNYLRHCSEYVES